MKKFLETVSKVWRWVLVALAIVLLGWLAMFSGFDLGGLIAKLLKKPNDGADGKIYDGEGKPIGKTQRIVRDTNPLRDKSKVKLEDGTVIKLPKGVKDTDVKAIVTSKAGVHYVDANGSRLTDIFDGAKSGSSDGGKP